MGPSEWTIWPLGKIKFSTFHQGSRPAARFSVPFGLGRNSHREGIRKIFTSSGSRNSAIFRHVDFSFHIVVGGPSERREFTREVVAVNSTLATHECDTQSLTLLTLSERMPPYSRHHKYSKKIECRHRGDKNKNNSRLLLELKFKNCRFLKITTQKLPNLSKI